MQSTLANDTVENPLPTRDPLSHTTIHRYLVTAADVGDTGYVDGGTLLGWAHRAALATATRWTGGRCVAASLSHFHLHRPIGVAERVEVRACLVYTGTDSLHMLVTIVVGDASASGNVQIAQCPIVFVAVDERGDPIGVPPWTPATMLELQRQRQARVRIRTRLLVEDAIAGQRYGCEGTAPVTTKHVLVSRSDGDRDGTVHGGRLIRWIDEAANVCAATWSGVRGITSYVSSIRFCAPVVIGEHVTVTAQVVHTGPRSVHVGVRVMTADVVTGVTRLAAEGVVVVANLDAHGKARQVRKWTPTSPEDVRLDRHGLALAALRQSFEPYSTATEWLSARPSSLG